MKIGILTQWYDPEPGPASLPGVLARELARRGHDVTVVTGFPNYPTGRLHDGYQLRLRDCEIVGGVNVVRTVLYPNHGPSGPGRIANYVSFGLSSLFFGHRALRNVDVIWVNYSPVTVGFALFAQRYLRKTPIVSEIADLWPETLDISGIDTTTGIMKIPGWFLRLWINRMYKASDSIVHISPGVREILERRGVPSEKLMYIPKPSTVQSNNLTAGKAGPNLSRIQLGIPEDDIVVLYAGSIGVAQGLGTLLSAAEMLADQPISIIVAGSGSEDCMFSRDNIRSSNIVYLGRITPHEVNEVTKISNLAYISLVDSESSAYTMPSKTQTLLATGMPIVAAASGDLAQVIVDADCGRVVSQSDPRQIADAISSLAALGPTALKRIGARGKRFHDEHFSLAATTNRVERVLGTVAKATTGTIMADGNLIISSLKRKHIGDAVSLHARAFPGFFLTKLGGPFLKAFYSCYLEDVSSLTVAIYDTDWNMLGVCVGSSSPRDFFKRIVKRRLFSFGLAAGRAAVKNPQIALRLVESLLYRGDSSTSVEGYAILSSICVSPEAQGLGIGGRLIAEWTARARDRGVESAYLSTDAVANDEVNRFYVSSGWNLDEQYITKRGRKMNRYVWNVN